MTVEITDNLSDFFIRYLNFYMIGTLPIINNVQKLHLKHISKVGEYI